MDPLSPTEQMVPTDELDARLRSLAEVARWPATPDVVGGVVTSLRAARPSSRRAPILRMRWVVVLALLALILGVVVVGAAVLGLPGLRLGFTDVLPSPAVVQEPQAIRRWLGMPGDLAQAREALGDDLLLPEALGVPDEVYLGTGAWPDRVALIYHPGPGAAAVADGIGLIVTEWGGAFDERMGDKWLQERGGHAERLDVAGSPGYWLTGKPHVIEFLDAESGVGPMPSRLVGDVLLWQTGSVVYRIESPLGRDATLAIAESMRR